MVYDALGHEAVSLDHSVHRHLMARAAVYALGGAVGESNELRSRGHGPPCPGGLTYFKGQQICARSKGCRW